MLIVHFSQDFRPGKPQLGGFARLRNTTTDGNRHIVFTLHFGDASTRELAVDHLRVVSFGTTVRRLRWFNRWHVARSIGRRAAAWLEHQAIVPDVLFGHSQLMNFAVLRALRARLRLPLAILWEANGIAGSQLFDGSRHPAHILQAIHQAYVFRHASHVIAQTAQSKRTLIRSFFVPPSKITVVTNGVDAEATEWRKEYGPLRAPLLAGYIGLHDDLNGARFLMDALPRLQSIARFRLIGAGPYAERARTLADSGALEFLGAIPHREMAAQLVMLDTLVIPRVRCFGSDHFIPTKVLEAMGAGLIVVASNVGGLTEVIDDRRNGFLFEAGSADDFVRCLREVAALSGEEARMISAAARSTACTHYDWRDRHILLGAIYRQFRFDGVRTGGDTGVATRRDSV